ncbi:DNA-directed RNA polymerase III subunit RPC7 isoform X2 [Nerophis ophidion]|uniref:DNA-directed RNA polymerase III subunit RPC7 isoform X2 n=1 Tax=Nerophis ophidion TaxID=159077 RepID=UPI002AE0802E|nr:DNA-directed RNA polymerase III subunit RPC7 isoform X2 [Nerophis ophidion]
MAGKGRGVAAFTFNIDALGIGRGNMPEARVGPSLLFPVPDFKPVPLKAGEVENYMLALKQEMRGAMGRMPHNIKFHAKKADVQKYTERYLKQKHEDHEDWTPELMPQKKKAKVKTGQKKKKAVKISSKDAEAVLTKLNELEKKDDGEKSDEEKPKKTGNEEEEEEDIEGEEYEEEDIEEDNDYIESYFDNGEDFAAASDDNMDGEATY